MLFLALATGATTSMFAVVNQILLKPPAGVHDAATLFRVTSSAGTNQTALGSKLSLPGWTDLRSSLPPNFDIAVTARSRADINVGNAATSEPVLLVSSNYFELLGVRPMLGALFVAQRTEDASPKDIVLARPYWERAFGSNTSVIGKSVRLNGVVYRIIGVADAAFTGVDLDAPSLWVPVRHAEDLGVPGQAALSRDRLWLTAIGRRPASMPLRDVDRFLSVATTEGRQKHLPGMRGELVASDIRAPASTDITSPLKIAQWLLTLAIVLCAMAAVNIGVLLVARGYARREELAIRRALGASFFRIVLQMATEAMLLVVFGGAVGVFLSRLFLGVVRRATGSTLTGVDWRVTVFLIALLAALTLVATLLPAVGNVEVGTSPSSASLRATTGTRALAAVRLLLALQFSLAVLLASATSLLIKQIMTASDLGLVANVSNLAVISTPIVYDPQFDLFMERLEERLRGTPGVLRVSRSAAAPMQRSMTSMIAPPPHASADEMVPVSANNVAPGWFATVGMPIVQGRDFDARDKMGSEKVAIVNQAMAKWYWRDGRGALGRCIPRFANRNQCVWRIVGVVSDAKVRTVVEAPQPQFYLPISQGPPVAHLLVVRTHGPVSEILAKLRMIADQVAGSPTMLQIESVNELVGEQTLPWRRAGAVASVFTIVALACVGLGIVAVGQFLFAAGRREMAVRLALGATPIDLMAQTVWQRGRELAAAALLGWGSFVAGRGLITEPLELASADAIPLASLTTLTLLAFAIAMTIVGCRRVTRIEPAAALRAL